jgi:hypothetical protein
MLMDFLLFVLALLPLVPLSGMLPSPTNVRVSESLAAVLPETPQA